MLLVSKWMHLLPTISNGQGLQYPPLLTGLPFICELCSVQANIGHEPPSPTDLLSLVALKRTCLIDLVHYWSTSMLHKYMSGLAGQCVKLFCGWLGWLHSDECFTLTGDSVKITPLAAAFGLPSGLGYNKLLVICGCPRHSL